MARAAKAIRTGNFTPRRVTNMGPKENIGTKNGMRVQSRTQNAAAFVRSAQRKGGGVPWNAPAPNAGGYERSEKYAPGKGGVRRFGKGSN